MLNFITKKLATIGEMFVCHTLSQRSLPPLWKCLYVVLHQEDPCHRGGNVCALDFMTKNLAALEAIFSCWTSSLRPFPPLGKILYARLYHEYPFHP